MWDLRQSFDIGFEYIGLMKGNISDFSNFSSWLPLSAEVARGNFFPIEPSLGLAQSSFEFFPYLTLWLHGVLIAFFGLGGAQLIGSTFFPMLSFALMVLIYRCYLPWRWSIAISALGVFGFSSMPFRDFLIGALSGEGWRDLGMESRPDIMGFPFPSISLLSFLAVFYLTIFRTYMSRRRALFLSIFWALQSQIHVINALIGLPFWFSFLGLRLWRANKNGWTRNTTKDYVINLLVAIFICSPAMIAIALIGDYENRLGFIFGGEFLSAPFDWFSIGAYFLLPLLSLFITYKLFRVDPYELVFKFLPVWVVMTVELSLILVWQVFELGVPSDLIETRLSMFFLHLFYFVPTIYCVCRGQVENFKVRGEISVWLKLRFWLFWFFKDASLVYIPILLIALTGFVISSSEKSYQQFSKVGLSSYIQSQKELKILMKELPSGSGVIGASAALNIIPSVRERQASLWVNSFSSKKSVEESVRRYATYGKTHGWSESQFVRFMLPKDEPIHLSKESFDFLSSKVIPGLGYWLVFNRRPLTPQGREEFLALLRKEYNSETLEIDLKNYNINRILLNENKNTFKDFRVELLDNYILISNPYIH